MITQMKTKQHNLKWPYIPDNPYKILIIGSSGSGKTNALLNLINNQPDIDKMYLCSKDPYEAKYQFLINKIESVAFKRFNDPKAFIKYSNDMQGVYKNIDEYNTENERKMLIGFDEMIADMINYEKLNSVVTDIFITGRKLNISLLFYHTIYFKVPKDSAHLSIMKIRNKRQLQLNAINHSSDINSKDFIKIYKKCTAEPYSFLVNHATLASDNPLRFRKNLFNI